MFILTEKNQAAAVQQVIFVGGGAATDQYGR